MRFLSILTEDKDEDKGKDDDGRRTVEEQERLPRKHIQENTHAPHTIPIPPRGCLLPQKIYFRGKMMSTSSDSFVGSLVRSILGVGFWSVLAVLCCAVPRPKLVSVLRSASRWTSPVFMLWIDQAREST